MSGRSVIGVGAEQRCPHIALVSRDNGAPLGVRTAGRHHPSPRLMPHIDRLARARRQQGKKSWSFAPGSFSGDRATNMNSPTVHQSVSDDMYYASRFAGMRQSTDRVHRGRRHIDLTECPDPLPTWLQQSRESSRHAQAEPDPTTRPNHEHARRTRARAEENNMATTSLIENSIDEAERRVWFLCGRSRRSVCSSLAERGL